MGGRSRIAAWGAPLVMPGVVVLLLILFLGRWGLLERWFPPRLEESSVASSSQTPPTPAEQPSTPIPSPAPRRLSLDAIKAEPILEVGGGVIYMDYFVKRLRLRQAEIRDLGRPFDGGSEPFRLLFNLSNEALLRQAEAQFKLHVPSEAIDQAILAQFGASDGEEAMTPEMEGRFREQLKESALTEQEYRQMVESGLLAGELERYLKQHLPKAAIHIQLQIILLRQPEEAEKVLARIQAGEDFTELARALSQDHDSASKGGHVGWVPEGVFDPAFDEVAFDLLGGSVGGPVATQGGYYLLRVLEREDGHPVSPENLSRLETNALEYWLGKERRKNHYRYYFDSAKYDLVLRYLRLRESVP